LIPVGALVAQCSLHGGHGDKAAWLVDDRLQHPTRAAHLRSPFHTFPTRSRKATHLKDKNRLKVSVKLKKLCGEKYKILLIDDLQQEIEKKGWKN
jgi:hypothetical protein